MAQVDAITARISYRDVLSNHKLSGLLVGFLIGLLGGTLNCSRSPVSKSSPDYMKAVEDARKAKDKSFKEETTSPIPVTAKPSFTGLAYYPIDPQFRIEIVAQPFGQHDTVEMLTSSGEVRSYLRYAFADFPVAGQRARLTIYALKKEGRVHYFLPFKDSTNGTETYPAGRYLEVEIDSQWRTVLDFNKAYNPYCAYNRDYSCPIPPGENFLKIPIRAGERYLEVKS
ncbi:MAG: DUF1684 domain-containing protein [Acidobacteria bacterium]|nr:DUF1684 domain-containing protein [Acidobacteriota bacterium]MBI3656136.1 DUF1684 domain-containing protein [Acidobacteriota bacterium]